MLWVEKWKQRTPDFKLDALGDVGRFVAGVSLPVEVEIDFTLRRPAVVEKTHERLLDLGAKCGVGADIEKRLVIVASELDEMLAPPFSALERQQSGEFILQP